MTENGEGRLPALGLTGIAASVALTFVTGLLGTSAVQAPLPGSGPPFSLAADPSAELVVALQLTALLLGATGLAMAGLAAYRGWSPRPRRLMVAGVLAAAALMCVPPMGTADPHAYASYGRIVTLGANPYLAAPDDFPRDPVASAAKPPWTEEPSPYGPLATAEQALVSWIAGDSLSLTVFLLSVMNALAFLATGLLLYALARRHRGRQIRAALLWTLNPVLLYELVAGAHLDALAILPVVGAVALIGSFAWSGWVSGALVGAAAVVKAPFAITGGGLLWGARTGRTSWARDGWPVVVGAAAVVIGAYAVAGLPALEQLGRTSGYISLATPWHLVEGPLVAWLGDGVARGLIQALAYSSLAALTVAFCYGLPHARIGLPSRRNGRAGATDENDRTRPQEAGRSPIPDPARTAKTHSQGSMRMEGQAPGRTARVALAFALAWLLTAPYVLPWYDALAWALIVILPWSRFDALLLVRTTVLAIPYIASLPARLPADMEWLVTVVRGQVTPVLMLLITLAFVYAALRPRAAAGTGTPGTR